MVTATCLHDGCNWTTPVGDIQIVSVQLTIHGHSHSYTPAQVDGGGVPSYNTKKPDRPEVKQNMTNLNGLSSCSSGGPIRKMLKLKEKRMLSVGKVDAISNAAWRQ